MKLAANNLKQNKQHSFTGHERIHIQLEFNTTQYEKTNSVFKSTNNKNVIKSLLFSIQSRYFQIESVFDVVERVDRGQFESTMGVFNSFNNAQFHTN